MRYRVIVLLDVDDSLSAVNIYEKVVKALEAELGGQHIGLVDVDAFEPRD